MDDQAICELDWSGKCVPTPSKPVRLFSYSIPFRQNRVCEVWLDWIVSYLLTSLLTRWLASLLLTLPRRLVAAGIDTYMTIENEIKYCCLYSFRTMMALVLGTASRMSLSWLVVRTTQPSSSPINKSIKRFPALSFDRWDVLCIASTCVTSDIDFTVCYADVYNLLGVWVRVL